MKKQLPHLLSLFCLLLSFPAFAQPGISCADPIVIGALPFQHKDNTANFSDNFDVSQGTSCNASPSTINFLDGNEVFYSFQATEDMPINVTLKPVGSTSTFSSVFVYDGCSNVGVNCVAGAANSNVGTRSFNMSTLQGHTYIIVVSSSSLNQTVSYDLLIQKEDCAPKPVGAGADNITFNSAHLFWNAQAYSSWEVAVQPFGELVPSGAGVLVTSPEFNAVLTPATGYQYWVRAECTPGSGIWTGWAGPFPFNSTICDPSQTCAHTFRLSNSSNTGWGTTRMQVRQNGIVVATLGAQLSTGLGPVDVVVPLCDNIPFDLYWNVLGNNSQQRRVSIMNSFGQTIYTKPEAAGVLNEIVYSGVVECDTPQCDLTPTNVTIGNVTNYGATIYWTAPATTSWDIFIQPAGGPEPDSDTVPTYNDIFPATTSFTTTIPLMDDHCYDVYVRVNCAPQASAWSVLTANSTFCTIPTCYKPTNTIVIPSTITTTSATFAWEPGNPDDTQFELILFPGPIAPATPPDDGTPASYVITIPAGGPYTFTATDLLPATIYYPFIRTRCTSEDVSLSMTFPVFNTVTCEPQNKCLYKFLLKNSTGNSWNGARMQVRQNGIIIATLGASSINNSSGVTIALCNDIPFDLFWSVEGTAPENIGVSIQSAFFDVIYTKPAGIGAVNSVLFSAMGDCDPPACAKPTNVVVSGLTPTSATMSWTDNSVPTAPAYALYIIPTGGAEPLNNPATQPTIASVSNPFTISDAAGYALIPSTSYTFYIKSVCSETDESPWPILFPVSFVTPPLNDQCINATPLVVNTNQQCLQANSMHGRTYGATANFTDADLGVGTGCVTTDDDIWFTFVATAPILSINFNNIVNTPDSASIGHSLYSGTCGDFIKLYCSAAPKSTAEGLVVGQTYYIRVYTNSPNPTQYIDFDLCITTGPANDEAISAVNVEVNPQWLCNPLLSVAGNTLGATGSLPAGVDGTCTGTDDDVWFKFVATSNMHFITVNDVIATGNGVTLRHSVLSGLPGNLVNLYCTNAFESAATGLTIGETYYIRVYTPSSNAALSASFRICVSTPPPPASNDECLTAISIEVNATPGCDVTAQGSLIGATPSTAPAGCLTGQDDDVWFKFTAVSGQQIISLLNIHGTTQNLNHAVYTGECGNLTQKYCSAAGEVTSSGNNYIVGQTYYLRVWSSLTTSQVVVFEVCVGTPSSCQNAASFCGSSPDDPYIFSNTTNVENSIQVACLGSIPNPTYYILKISEPGSLVFNILQNTRFNADGEPTGTNLDVDFAAWGPFENNSSFCGDIALSDCPSCPNNTVNPNFYPFGNIIDCSYDASFTETLTINNAVAGQYYVVLITNFNGNDGFIRLQQTNAGEAGAGGTVCTDKIRLIAYVDANNNNVKDEGELNFTEGNFIYQKNDAGPFGNISSETGVYDLFSDNPFDSYDFTFEIFPEFATYYAISSTGFSNISIQEGSGSQLLYFPITLTQPYSDVSVTIIPTGPPVSGFQYKNKIVYRNNGLLPVSGTLTYTKDPAIEIISISQPGATLNGDGFTYDFSGLLPYETRAVYVTMDVPVIPAVSLGQLLNNSAEITTANDIHPADNFAEVTQEIVGSYDPNDKSESHGGKVDIDELNNGSYLYYTIRFQNTGTYHAVNVRLEDVLDDMLDESSIRVVSASHSYDLLRTENHLTWEFKNIYLPAGVEDEAGSHGYVTFKIRPKTGIAVGDIIENTAEIYFDFNPPIVTNTVQTEVSTPLGTDVFDISNVALYPNPANTMVYLNLQHTTENLEQVTLYDVLGKAVKTVKANHQQQTTLDVSALAKGVYLVEIKTTTHLKLIRKLVVN